MFLPYMPDVARGEPSRRQLHQRWQLIGSSAKINCPAEVRSLLPCAALLPAVVTTTTMPTPVPVPGAGGMLDVAPGGGSQQVVWVCDLALLATGRAAVVTDNSQGCWCVCRPATGQAPSACWWTTCTRCSRSPITS